MATADLQEAIDAQQNSARREQVLQTERLHSQSYNTQAVQKVQDREASRLRELMAKEGMAARFNKSPLKDSERVELDHLVAQEEKRQQAEKESKAAADKAKSTIKSPSVAPKSLSASCVYFPPHGGDVGKGKILDPIAVTCRDPTTPGSLATAFTSIIDKDLTLPNKDLWSDLSKITAFSCSSTSVPTVIFRGGAPAYAQDTVADTLLASKETRRIDLCLTTEETRAKNLLKEGFYSVLNRFLQICCGHPFLQICCGHVPRRT